MRLVQFFSSVAIAVSVLPSAQSAFADSDSDYDAGSFIVRIGASYVDPDESNTNFTFDGVPSVDFFGSNMDLDESWGWNISGVWLPVEHWGLELMYTGGVGHDATLRPFAGLPDRNSLRLGSFDAQMSDLFINWYPLDPSCLGQPYVGLGVNYTDFYDEELSGAANQFLIDSGLAVDYGSLGMGYSWGLSAQIGIDFLWGRNTQWLGNASIIYRDVDVNDINISFPNIEGFNRLVADFDYDPWTLNLDIGYKF